MYWNRKYVYDTYFNIFVLMTCSQLMRPCTCTNYNRFYPDELNPFIWSASNREKRAEPKVTPLTGPVTHGEGPHWDTLKSVLYFVDIHGKRVYQYNPRTSKVTFAAFDEPVGAVFPIQNQQDKFLVGLGTTLTEVTWNGENTTRPCIRKLHTIDVGKPNNRFNDGKVDSTGRLWLGTMNEEPNGNVKLYQGTLYRLSKETCRLEPIIPNVTISNGIVWSFDDKYMFYIDTNTLKVVRYTYDIFEGSINNEKEIFDFKKEKIDGVPDGMTIDNDENLWIACWQGSQVIKVDSRTGKLLGRIKMPVPRVTSVTFGDTFQTLYVTTSRQGLSDAELQKYPLSGALFSITDLNVIGHPNNAASGCIEYNNKQCSDNY